LKRGQLQIAAYHNVTPFQLKHTFDVVNVAAIELKTRDANFTKVRAEREWLRQ
jgi:hypothetical protein